MPSKKIEKPVIPSQTELLELLAAIDGVDGYESEHGNLRYWNAKSIDRARALLDSIEASAQSPK
jgi:hypothetical protein